MRFLLLTCLILAAAGSALAQCPTLAVVGPAGITEPGDSMTFRAEINLANPDLKYQWTISKSPSPSPGDAIESGQGTPEITVATGRRLEVRSITVTVEVDGLPKECERVAHETAGIASRGAGHVYPYDEFGELPKNDQRGRLDLFIHELRANPRNVGFVDLYRKDKKKAEAIMRLYLSHLRFRKFDLSRISFRLGVKPESATVFWRIPIGSEPWPCGGCTTISGNNAKDTK